MCALCVYALCVYTHTTNVRKHKQPRYAVRATLLHADMLRARGLAVVGLFVFNLKILESPSEWVRGVCNSDCEARVAGVGDETATQE